jgi:membrane-bound lytic murein transglycosylase D
MEPARLPSPTPSANARVSYFLDRFTGSRREVVSAWVGRSTRYLAMMRETLRGHGLPEELVWVAMIESGFNPLAKSRAGAKGLWQFMPGTARRYGLRVDQWVDERVDPERSTLAAAGYLRDLYALFGSWPLAWAGYNAGEMTVSRAIRKAGSHDFWALASTNHLRRETKDFVPQIEAATLLAREPERYGFEIQTGASPAVESVGVPPSTDLRRLSAATGLSLATLRDLNPALVRASTPPGAPWELRVPEGSRGVVETALVGKTAGRATHEVHVVQPRDTIGAIAKRYGVSVDDVLRWNGFDARRVIRPGDRLRVAEADPQGQGGFR